MSHTPIIKPLPVLLANQIAAGEVVERPSSVIKELVENSIDAGATRIDIDVELGGTRSIRVVDDGIGIHKDELDLAVQPHATSKIATTEDLAAIRSLGFRGEALASISSVSRFKLVSKHQDADIAWQIDCEGSHQQVSTSPAALKQGTLIEVNDLFFNTPARRKFLRSPKTEFAHVEDVVKRLALSQPQVTITLRHNSKTIRRYHPANSQSAMERRIAQAIENKFIRHALFIEREYEGLRVKGWLAAPDYTRSQNDGQFIFINGRLVKDRTLTHAAKQGFQGLIAEGRQPAYVICLEMAPEEVDVNVHPTKHEVRFSQPRLVHDLLVSSVHQALQSSGIRAADTETYSVSEARGDFQHTRAQERQFYDAPERNRQTSTHTSYSCPEPSGSVPKHIRANKQAAESQGYYQFYRPLKSQSQDSELGRFLMVLAPAVLFERQGNLIAIEQALLIEHLFALWCKQDQAGYKPLLMPISCDFEHQVSQEQLDALQHIGFQLQLESGQRLNLVGIPQFFSHQQGINWLQILTQALTEQIAPQQLLTLLQSPLEFDPSWLDQFWSQNLQLCDIEHRQLDGQQLLQANAMELS